MKNQDKYKIEVKGKQWNPKTQKHEIIPLPKEKVTGITWEQLVKVIAESGILIADEIRLHNVGTRGGTAKINRDRLFELWKAAETYRATSSPS